MSSALLEAPAPAFTLRSYQLEADAAVMAGYARGVKRGLVTLPTGLGKTVCLTHAPTVLNIEKPDVTLIVAHREELIEQTVVKVRGWNPNIWVEVEMAERRASAMCEVVVASVQSLQGKRLEDFLTRFARRIRLLIVDEAHHATAPTYRKLIERVLEERSDSMVLGYTATPNRSDQVGLHAVFDEVIYHRDIKWAIDEGYLVPVACWRVRTRTSLDDVHTRAGEFVQSELSEAVNNQGRNDTIVSAYCEHTPGKKAIVFCVDVNHARTIAQRFLDAGVEAGFAHGETPKAERREIIDRFKRGEIKVLANCALWTEGFDEPSVEVVIGARPTKSSLLYTQMAGRGLRPLDEVAHLLGPTTTAAQRRQLIEQSAKPQAIILDVVDQASRHSLVTFPSLWGLPPSLDAQGKRITEVAKRFDELAEKNPRAARQLESFEQIATEIDKIDQFAVPEIDEEVQASAELAWMLVSNDVYRLRLPTRISATDAAGNPIHAFDRALRDAEAQAKKAKKWPYRETALAMLGVRAEDVVEKREMLEIASDVLNHAEVFLGDGKDRKPLGKTEDLPSAFKRAEQWITNNRPLARQALSMNAPWRAAEPTDGQRNLLRKFGTPEHMLPRTRGEASRLIEQLLSRKKAAS